MHFRRNTLHKVSVKQRKGLVALNLETTLRRVVAQAKELLENKPKVAEWIERSIGD